MALRASRKSRKLNPGVYARPDGKLQAKIAIPADVQFAYGRTSVTRSLKTDDADEASGGAEELPPEGGWGSQPPNATGKMMVLETYHSGGGISSGAVEAGLVRFEYFRGEYPLGQDEHSPTYGDLMHWVVDVTNY